MDVPKTWGRRFASAALAALCATSVMAWPQVAMAEPESVGQEQVADTPAQDQETTETPAPAVQFVLNGVDFLQTDATSWDVLRVDGARTEPVYVDLRTASGEYLAFGQPHDINKTDSYRDDLPNTGAPIAHVITLDMGKTVAQAMADGQPYTLVLRTASRGGETLFEGKIYPVYANLQDGSDSVRKLIGIRTVSKAQESQSRNLGAGITFYSVTEDGTRVAYQRENPQALDNRFDGKAYVVDYKRVADNVSSGSVTYVDFEGNVIRTESFPGIGALSADKAFQAPVEQSFFRDGKYYRVVSFRGNTIGLHADYANHRVMVREVTGMTPSAYQVTIRYVDEKGNLLWSDNVDVKGTGYQYTVPTTFSSKKQSGESDFYTLKRIHGASGDWSAPVIRFDETKTEKDFYDLQGRRSLTVQYDSKDVNKTVKYTFVEVDGSTSTEIGRQVFDVTPEKSAEYVPAEKTINGVKYVPWTGNSNPITCDWGDLSTGVDLLQYVYYVPEGYVQGAPYELTVKDVNIANNEVLRTRTIMVDPSMNDYMTIVGDEGFSQDGHDYVRLAGQDSGVRHSYFTPARTYTFYYRDVNDTLNANTTITRTQIIETERVVELPGNVTYSFTALPVALNPDGTAATGTPVAATGAAAGTPGAAAAGATPAGAAAAPATVDAGVTPGDGTTIIDDADNPLANLEGEDTATERIGDDENPLAGGMTAEQEATLRGVIAGGAAAVLGYLLWAIWKRRKENDKSDENLTA